jgi:uncharacterized FlgJ-related protein
MAIYDEILYNTAIKAKFTPMAALFCVAQARLESANYTSNVFKNNTNTSGIKFIGTGKQPLATRGTIAPPNEQSANCRKYNRCVDGDFYAKFKTVQDSADDKINRLYSYTMHGVTPSQLRNAKTPEEFAALLYKRKYYGGRTTIDMYAKGMRAVYQNIKIKGVNLPPLPPRTPPSTPQPTPPPPPPKPPEKKNNRQIILLSILALLAFYLINQKKGGL